jgi:adenylate cyclase
LRHKFLAIVLAKVEYMLESNRVMGGCYFEYKWKEALCRVALELEKVCGIGRSQANTIALTDAATISHRHASVHSVDGQFYLTDLNSRNGTMLNGRPVSAPTPLKDGDIVKVGGCELIFHGTAVKQPEALTSAEAFKTHLLVSRSLVTVLVTDIKDYTGLTLRLGEARMSEIVGTLFEKAGAILNANFAWGQKYIGDAVMGVWMHEHETPTTQELERIFRSLLGIQKVFADLNAEQSAPVPITFGAAVNTGYAATGNLGSKAVPDQTAIGDTVNMAFRLESATRGLGADVVLGKLTYSFLSGTAEACDGIERHSVSLKGYPQPEEAYSTNFATLARIMGSPKFGVQEQASA